MNQAYLDTVRLLLAAAPSIFENPRFALKGGTALNLFVQDLPRLSIDLDVVFVDHTLDRAAALTAISTDLSTAKVRLERLGFTATVVKLLKGEEVKMFVEGDAARMKVEVNFVFRGTLLPVERQGLVQSAQETFTANVRLPILQVAELYGSKLVAAMDRQHPRDLFDVHIMLARHGLPTEFVDCFVAYLACHNRPVHEVLFPQRRPIEEKFKNEFQGMTREEIVLDSLLQSQAQIQSQLPFALTAAHREFLLSLVRLEPAWELMPFRHLKDLPAMQWKIANLEHLRARNHARFQEQHSALLDKFMNVK